MFSRSLLALVVVGSGAAWAEEAAPPPSTPAPQVARPAAVEPPPVQAAAHPNAGFANEVFFLRSDDDNFILTPTGRFQFDFYGFQPGTRQSPDQFLPKRARIEAQGSFLKRWDFSVGSEFTSPAAPTATDIWLNGAFAPQFNLQLGQFDGPFTMENRTSDRWTDLQERSMVARALAIPENKQIGAMAWGQPEGKYAYWSLGLFNGEGINVLPHRSNSFDVMGRAWVAPFGLAKFEPLKNAWLGASGWNGFRGATPGSQVDRLSMKDQTGFVFFSPASGAIHVGGAGHVKKWGLELNVPVGQFVLKGEFVHSDEGLREVDTASKNAVVRRSTLVGDGFYARLSYFVWGDPLINGLGGMQLPNHLYERALKPGKTEDALQVVLEYDHIAFAYTAQDGATAAQDKLVGQYAFDVAAVGVNYWFTRHLRFTGNLLYNTFGGSTARPLLKSDHSWEATLRAALSI